MKATLSIVLKVSTLTIILFACFVVAGQVVGLQGNSPAPQEAATAAALLPVVCLLSTVVLAHIILRSRWAGWRLIATVFAVYYGVTTLLSQIESAVFITRLPPGTLPRLWLMGALVAAPFSVLAVLILGKRTADATGGDAHPRLVMPIREWVWKLSVIALAYLILYFTFGYFIAWQDPAVREYYGGTDEGSFLAQMRTTLEERWWLVPLQIVRAMLWVAIALPVIRMLKGRWQETALAIALLFGVLATAQLLIPNPYMPEAVRIAHLVETASSNFLFGLLVATLLTRRRSFDKPVSSHDLHGKHRHGAVAF